MCERGREMREMEKGGREGGRERERETERDEEREGAGEEERECAIERGEGELVCAGSK